MTSRYNVAGIWTVVATEDYDARRSAAIFSSASEPILNLRTVIRNGRWKRIDALLRSAQDRVNAVGVTYVAVYGEEQFMAQAKSRYVWGLINPTVGMDEQDSNGKPERLLPQSVEVVSNGLGIRDYTHDGVEEAIVRYDALAEDLVGRGAQRVVLAGVPISALNVPGDAAAEAVVAAMHHLGVSKIAVGSRWAAEVNEATIRYFNDADIEVLTITSEGQWAAQGSQMSFEKGVLLAFRLGRQAMREAPHAQGLFLPGGAWRPLAAVPILEEDFGIPVFTNGNTRAWRIIHDGHAPPVDGWGTLLATP
jgi:maleate cis-trans isomerase